MFFHVAWGDITESYYKFVRETFKIIKEFKESGNNKENLPLNNLLIPDTDEIKWGFEACGSLPSLQITKEVQNVVIYTHTSTLLNYHQQVLEEKWY
jgi:hypothetical protein